MPYEPPERLNIADYFLDARVREGRGDRPALLSDEGTLSYGDVRVLANRFAGVLVGSGLEPEQRVLIALPDGPAYVGALFGTLKAGGVVVMVNPGLPAAEIQYFLEYTRARIVVAHRESAAAFRVAAAASRFVKRVLVSGEDLEAALAAAAPEWETFPAHRDDPAVWLFSGGTTGRPKAVVQTHRAFANTTDCYARQVIGYTERDITLSVPKLYFGYATGSNLLFPFAAGGTAALFPEAATPETLFRRIAQFRPTVLVNVPTMINRMVSHPDAARQDLSSLRVCTSAGEALPAELYHRWKDTFGVELLDGLGTAEMWHIFISNRPGAVRPGTLGTVVPGFEVRVKDDAGQDVAPGETGWLWVRGGSRAIAYWQQMEKTEKGFRGEWYVSGDLIRRDADGFIHLVDRKSNMIISGGENIYPAEVENVLMRHARVADAAVIGVPSERWGETVKAIVVRRDAAASEDELIAFCRDQLARYKCPTSVDFVDAIPRNPSGKILKTVLREPYWQGRDRRVS